jgi:predicted metal-dependent peptidase
MTGFTRKIRIYIKSNIYLEKRFVHLESLTTKEINWHIVYNLIKRPTSEEKKWNEKVDFVLNEDMF